MEPITPVGSIRQYDKNPNRVPKLVAICRVNHQMPIRLIEDAASSVSDDSYSFRPNTSAGFPGQIINLYCHKQTVHKHQVETFLEGLNLRLDSMMAARQQTVDIGPSKGVKPRPRRIAPQRRRG